MSDKQIKRKIKKILNDHQVHYYYINGDHELYFEEEEASQEIVEFIKTLLKDDGKVKK